MLGFDELKTHLTQQGYTPDWAAGVTGIQANVIRRVAEDYARAKPAAIFCNAGISHQLNAFDTYRALAFLAAITGNVGVNGGGCNFMHNTWPGGLNLPPVIGVAPTKGDALPVGPDWFAESILASRPYPLKAIVTEGNPIIGCANTKKVQDAYRKLEFYVFTGLFMEEPAYYADVILPVQRSRDLRATCGATTVDSGQHAAVSRVGESKTDIEMDRSPLLRCRHDTKNPPDIDWQPTLGGGTIRNVG